MSEPTAPARRAAPADRAGFVARYGAIYEHSPWVAEAVWDAGQAPNDAQGLGAAMAAVVDAAPQAARLTLLRAHPDLAGKLALAGELTQASRAEQAGAGLDQCTAEELAEFQQLNAAYQARFGFPFIFAVAGFHRTEILAAFRRRVQNTVEAEFDEAIRQTHCIAAHRLRALALAP